MEITDNHFHLDPEGQKEKAVKIFLNSGGTRLVLVHKPYSPWDKIEQFKEQVKITLKLSKKAREAGAKVATIASPHPVQLVKLLDKYDSKIASELYLEAVDFCTNLVEENEIVGLGELGRPHFEVNDEISALKEMLLSAVELLKADGRLVVLSYHSLEDRLVKNLMKRGNFDGKVDKDFYGNPIKNLKEINPRAIIASDQEIHKNPRARSAKLRVAVKNNDNYGG